jgi:heptosyltransferase-2
VRILILALSGIGDALLFTPALKLLRREVPGAQIDVLAMFRGVQDMFQRNPHVNTVHYFDFLKEGYLPSLRFVVALRGKYDASVNVYPSNRKEYNAINFLVGGSKRAGVRYLRMDRRNFGFLNNIRIPEDDDKHNVQHNIELIGELLGVSFAEKPDLEFPLNDEDRAVAADLMRQYGIEGSELVVGFHPGGSTLKNHVNKRWMPARFSELGTLLAKERNARVLVFGGPEEEGLKREVVGGIGVASLSVDTTNLAHTAAVMQRCDLFVSNDSSLLHVASALKRKVVLVTGPINPAYTGPWNTPHRVVSLRLECSPCFVYSPRPLKCTRDDVKFKCLKEIEVDTVYRAALELLKS